MKEQIWLQNENICDCHFKNLIGITTVYRYIYMYSFNSYWHNQGKGNMSTNTYSLV